MPAPTLRPALNFSLLGVLSILLGGLPLTAQQRTLVDRDRGCADCRITLHPVVDLGEAEGEGYVEMTPALTRMGGRLALANGWTEQRILLFEADGRYVRSAGGSGRGPGEMHRILGLGFLPPDSIVVFDRDGRVTVWGPDLRVGRTSRFPGQLDGEGGITLPDGSFLVTGYRAGAPGVVHHLRSDGTVGWSVGGSLYPASVARYVAVDTVRAQVWVAHYEDYRIDRYDLEGRLLEEWVSRPSWFDPASPEEQHRGMPPTNIMDVHVDEDGLLWVLARVPAEGWQGAVEQLPASREAPYRVTDYPAYWDTVLEVIDPTSGRLLASRRFTEWFTKFLPSGEIHSTRTDEWGNPRTHVWRVRLTRGG